MNEIQQFDSSMLSYHIDATGTPWFKLADIAKVLGMSEGSMRKMKERGWFDDDEMNTVTVCHGNRGNPTATYVSESALYRILNRSISPKARPFERWVTKEVLPSIRKHGAYMTNDTIKAVLTNPDTIIKLATELKEERERRIKAEREKSLISDRQTATAMATASTWKRRATSLESKMGMTAKEGKSWYRVTSIPWLEEYFHLGDYTYKAVGEVLDKISEDINVAIAKVPSTNKDTIPVYHARAVHFLKEWLDSNPKLLKKFRVKNVSECIEHSQNTV